MNSGKQGASKAHSRLSNGSVGANFAFRRIQNLLRGTCSENGLGANSSKYLLQLEQILANICTNWRKYLLPIANPLICQNGMEEPPKCFILRLNFQNFLWVVPQTPLPSKCHGRAAKMHHFKVQISKFLGGCPPKPSHLPAQNGMEEPPNCTNLRLKFPGDGPQAPLSTYPLQNGIEELPKYTIKFLGLIFQNFLGVAAQTPSHLPTQNGIEESPKCTILRLKCQKF